MVKGTFSNGFRLYYSHILFQFVCFHLLKSELIINLIVSFLGLRKTHTHTTRTLLQTHQWLILKQWFFSRMSVFNYVNQQCVCVWRVMVCWCGMILSSSLSQSVQLLSCVRLFATPWTVARQASLSITNSRGLLKFMSIELVMPSSHLILCRPLLLPLPCFLSRSQPYHTHPLPSSFPRVSTKGGYGSVIQWNPVYFKLCG